MTNVWLHMLTLCLTSNIDQMWTRYYVYVVPTITEHFWSTSVTHTKIDVTHMSWSDVDLTLTQHGPNVGLTLAGHLTLEIHHDTLHQNLCATLQTVF